MLGFPDSAYLELQSSGKEGGNNKKGPATYWETSL